MKAPSISHVIFAARASHTNFSRRQRRAANAFRARHGVKKVPQSHARFDNHDNADGIGFEPRVAFVCSKQRAQFLEIASVFYLGNHDRLSIVRRKHRQISAEIAKLRMIDSQKRQSLGRAGKLSGN
jgi:hypothetical protein